MMGDLIQFRDTRKAKLIAAVRATDIIQQRRQRASEPEWPGPEPTNIEAIRILYQAAYDALPAHVRASLENLQL